MQSPANSNETGNDIPVHVVIAVTLHGYNHIYSNDRVLFINTFAINNEY